MLLSQLPGKHTQLADHGCWNKERMTYFTTSLLPSLETGISNICSNDSVNASAEKKTRPIVERVVFLMVLIVIIMASLAGNLLVLICIYLNRGFGRTVHLFIVHLSVADMCSAVVAMVSSLHALASDKWLMGPIWCDVISCDNYSWICFAFLNRYEAGIHMLYYHN